MPFPTDTFTGAGAALDEYINEVWSPRIMNFAKDKEHLALFFTDRSDELAGGGDTIHVGVATEMVAHAKSNATAVTLNTQTHANVSLVVNVWDEVSFAIEDGDAAKFLKSRYVQENFARNAGYTAGMVLEDAMYALFGTFTDSVGSSTVAILDSVIRAAIGVIETNTGKEVTNNQWRFFFEGKVWWNQIAGITTFQLHINTQGNDPVTKAPMKMLYGIPVSTSKRIPYISGTTGRYNALADRDAIHYAVTPLLGQGASRVRVQSNYIPQYLATVTTADLQFGVILARPTFGVNILSLAS